MTQDRKRDMLLNSFELLKDILEDEDDFNKANNLIEQMLVLDSEMALDMWVYLIKKYENYVTELYINETYYLTESLMDSIGRNLGTEKFTKIILQDAYLKGLLFSRYVYAGSHYDFTQKIILSYITQGLLDKANVLIELVYDNKNRNHSFMEVLDGIFFDIKHNETEISMNALDMLTEWTEKVHDKKERAKLNISLLGICK